MGGESPKDNNVPVNVTTKEDTKEEVKAEKEATSNENEGDTAKMVSTDTTREQTTQNPSSPVTGQSSAGHISSSRQGDGHDLMQMKQTLKSPDQSVVTPAVSPPNHHEKEDDQLAKDRAKVLAVSQDSADSKLVSKSLDKNDDHGDIDESTPPITSLHRNTNSRPTSAPGAVSVAPVTDVTTSVTTATTASANTTESSSLVGTLRTHPSSVERSLPSAEQVLSAELVVPNPDHDVEVAAVTAVNDDASSNVILAKAEKMEDVPGIADLTLRELCRNKKVRCVGVIVIILLLGLAVGLAVGLTVGDREGPAPTPAPAPTAVQSNTGEEEEEDGPSDDAVRNRLFRMLFG